MKDQALITAGIIFALVTLLQLTRIYFNFPVTVGHTLVPIWVNVIALIIFSFLSFWMFYALKMDSFK